MFQLRVDGYKWSLPFNVCSEGMMRVFLKRDCGNDEMQLRVQVRSGTKSSRYEVIFRPNSSSSPYRFVYAQWVSPWTQHKLFARWQLKNSKITSVCLYFFVHVLDIFSVCSNHWLPKTGLKIVPCIYPFVFGKLMVLAIHGGFFSLMQLLLSCGKILVDEDC